MQTSYIIGLAFLIISSFSWSQSRSEVETYIAKKGMYSTVIEAAKTNKHIEKCLPALQTWLTEQGQEITDFYLNPNGVLLSENRFLTIPLLHYDNFKRAYQIDFPNIDEGPYQPCLSPIWKNGSLMIDMQTMKVDSYHIWE